MRGGGRVLVEIALEAAAPLGVRSGEGESGEELGEGAGRGRPVDLPERVHQILRRHRAPIHAGGGGGGGGARPGGGRGGDLAVDRSGSGRRRGQGMETREDGERASDRRESPGGGGGLNLRRSRAKRSIALLEMTVYRCFCVLDFALESQGAGDTGPDVGSRYNLPVEIGSLELGT